MYIDLCMLFCVKRIATQIFFPKLYLRNKKNISCYVFSSGFFCLSFKRIVSLIFFLVVGLISIFCLLKIFLIQSSTAPVSFILSYFIVFYYLVNPSLMPVNPAKPHPLVIVVVFF